MFLPSKLRSFFLPQVCRILALKFQVVRSKYHNHQFSSLIKSWFSSTRHSPKTSSPVKTLFLLAILPVGWFPDPCQKVFLPKSQLSTFPRVKFRSFGNTFCSTKSACYYWPCSPSLLILIALFIVLRMSILFPVFRACSLLILACCWGDWSSLRVFCSLFPNFIILPTILPSTYPLVAQYLSENSAFGFPCLFDEIAVRFFNPKLITHVLFLTIWMKYSITLPCINCTFLQARQFSNFYIQFIFDNDFASTFLIPPSFFSYQLPFVACYTTLPQFLTRISQTTIPNFGDHSLEKETVPIILFLVIPFSIPL